MKSTLTFLLSAVLLGVQAQAATNEQDVDRYLATLAVDPTGAQLEPLGWAGISDARLYDVLEKQLLDVAAQKPASKTDVKKYRHYIRSLGFSGQTKYIPTLKSLVSNKNYDNYAEHALRDQPRYQKWNPIISNRATFNPQRSDDVNRFMNMLASDDVLLNRIASRRIYDGVRDDALFEALGKKVQANYLRTDLRDDDADSVAWLVKALGSSQMEKYRELLTQVAQTAPNAGVARHAKLALEQNYK